MKCFKCDQRKKNLDAAALEIKRLKYEIERQETKVLTLGMLLQTSNKQVEILKNQIPPLPEGPWEGRQVDAT